MRDFRLEFEPFSFVMLHEVQVVKQVNDHSTAYIKGIIPQGNASAYEEMSIQNDHLPITITAVSDDGEAVKVFQGVTTSLAFEHMGNLVTMIVNAKSGSYLMDITKRFRTFQDSNVTHSEVLDLLGETYTDYNYIMKITGEQVETAKASSKSKTAPPPMGNTQEAAPSISRENANLVSYRLLENIVDQCSALRKADRGGRSTDMSAESAVRLSSFFSGEAQNQPSLGFQAMSNPEPRISQADEVVLRSIMDTSLQTMRSSGQLPAISSADRSVLVSCIGQSDRLSHLTPRDRGDFIAAIDSSLQTMERPAARPLSAAVGASALHSAMDRSDHRADLQAMNRSVQQATTVESSMSTMAKEVQDVPLDQFTVQYWETDWVFAKRLASRLHTFLVPADTHPGTRYYFGTPHIDGHVLDDSIDYKVVQDYHAADEKTRHGLEDAGMADALCYVVEHREIYAVGDLIKFQGMELCVEQIITTFPNQELVHTYYLRHKKGLRAPRFHNDKMIGASLDAQVIAVQKDEVQIQVTGDENTDQSIVQWFPFATVYSSPDGTGWYAMPEQGDQVRLYIPNHEEKEAVVFNALHVASGARSDPDIKSMRNKFGKEIRFTPNTLVMTNNAGMEISIIDDEGIRVESDKNIFIVSGGDKMAKSGG